MTRPLRALLSLLTIIGCLAPITASAQSMDPAGHWEGSITAPFGEIPIALDITSRDGAVIATFSRQDGSVSGFPLSDVEWNGRDLKMTLKASGGGTLRASIAGTQMTGSFAAFAGTAPFAVTRTGEARVAVPIVNKAISRSLEGTWTARLAAGADSTTFRMTLSNHDDGTATGVVADEHGVEVPLKFVQDGVRIMVDIPSARSTFTGTLNGNGTAIEGTYTEGALNAPIVFMRVK
jgi:hypothetical protein